METKIIYRNKKNRYRDKQQKGYISTRAILNMHSAGELFQIIDKATGENLTEKFIYNATVRTIYRTNDGHLSEIGQKGYSSLRKIYKLIEKNEDFRVIDKPSKKDITDKIKEDAIDYNNRFKVFSANLTMTEDEFTQHLNNYSCQEKLPFEFNFIDLFCGAGGLSSGLEMAGLNCLFGTDINNNAMETFALNHPHSEIYHGDIARLTKEMLLEKTKNKKIHLVAGGPPCQGFSTIGKGDPNAKKNSLFYEYCRVLEVLRPEYILFENVTGLLARKNEKILETIIREFEKLGFRVKIKVLEASKYGTPQKRKRTIILGSSTKYDFDFPEPVFDTIFNGKNIRAVTVGDVLEDIKDKEQQVYNHNLKYTKPIDEVNLERLKHIPEGRGIRYQRDEDELLPQHLKYDVDWKTMREGRFRELRLFRLPRNAPSPTINTANWQYYHPIENRRFTVRECARFQSFPNDFKFTGGTSNQMTQVGNAVPPLLGRQLGKAIIKSYLDKLENSTHYKNDLDKIRGDAFIYDKRMSLNDYFDRGQNAKT